MMEWFGHDSLSTLRVAWTGRFRLREVIPSHISGESEELREDWDDLEEELLKKKAFFG